MSIFSLILIREWYEIKQKMFLKSGEVEYVFLVVSVAKSFLH